MSETSNVKALLLEFEQCHGQDYQSVRYKELRDRLQSVNLIRITVTGRKEPVFFSSIHNSLSYLQEVAFNGGSITSFESISSWDIALNRELIESVDTKPEIAKVKFQVAIFPVYGKSFLRNIIAERGAMHNIIDKFKALRDKNGLVFASVIVGKIDSNTDDVVFENLETFQAFLFGFSWMTSTAFNL